jgi:RNA polymerase sigma-70 factor (ECF subfamily)
VGEGRHDPDLDALKSGDEAAFQALIQRFHGPMLRLAMAYVRDREVAEDVVQESWLTCLRSLHGFEGRSSLKTWILGIVINVARARRRKEARILPFSAFWRRDDSDSARPTVEPSRFGADGMWRSAPASWDNLPESKVLGDETLRTVRVAIDGLPPKQREVILLRDVAGLEAAEVSTALGISPANERVRLHRARAAVRKALEEYLR